MGIKRDEEERLRRRVAGGAGRNVVGKLRDRVTAALREPVDADLLERARREEQGLGDASRRQIEHLRQLGKFDEAERVRHQRGGCDCPSLAELLPMAQSWLLQALDADDAAWFSARQAVGAPPPPPMGSPPPIDVSALLDREDPRCPVVALLERSDAERRSRILKKRDRIRDRISAHDRESDSDEEERVLREYVGRGAPLEVVVRLEEILWARENAAVVSEIHKPGEEAKVRLWRLVDELDHSLTGPAELVRSRIVAAIRSLGESLPAGATSNDL